MAKPSRNGIVNYPAQDRALGLPKEQLGKRNVTKYTPELALEIVEQIAEGRTLKEITEGSDRYPARQTFNRWVAQYPELARAYADAKELSATAFEEEAIELGRAIKKEPRNSYTVRAYEVLMNQLRWSAAKRNPRVYTDRGAVQITVPVQIVTPLDLGQPGAQKPDDEVRVYDVQAQIIDGEWEEVRPQELERQKPGAEKTFADPKEVGRRRTKEAKELNKHRPPRKKLKLEYDN